MTITYRYTKNHTYFYRIKDQENKILNDVNTYLEKWYLDKNRNPVKPVTMEEFIEMVSSDFSKGRSYEDVYI